MVEGLAPGQYGAMIFQDLNKDGKMNFNLVGMPLEPYGFSNNSRGLFGPPRLPEPVRAAFEGALAAVFADPQGVLSRPARFA